MKSHNLNLRIGAIGVSIVGDPAGPPLEIEPAHRSFLVEDGQTQVTLRVHYESKPDSGRLEKVFEFGRGWTLFRHNGQFVLELASPVIAGVNRLASWDQQLDRADLYIPPEELQAADVSVSGVTVDPLADCLDAQLIQNVLAGRRLGVMVHACGIGDGRQGRLFLGPSGAGKSTMARLWRQNGATVLCDDRIIVRRLDGGFWIWGTPWHSDVGCVSPDPLPLAGIYFLVHASDNSAQALSPVEAATRLFLDCFSPLHDREGLEFTLEFLGQLASEIPCYELGFAPEAGVVEFVRGLE